MMSNVGLVLSGRLVAIRQCYRLKGVRRLGTQSILQSQARCINYISDFPHRRNNYEKSRNRGFNYNYYYGGSPATGSGLLQGANFRHITDHSVLARYIHSSGSLGDNESSSRPSSKVEQTVKDIEQELEKTKEGGVEVVVKRPLWKRVQDEILHYYHGFRLLLIDVRISANLIWRILNGKSLSRREYKQLIRTTSDLFRLVPFSVFIIVPFMELLLPFFIKMFPNLLPSTFQSNRDRESKMKAELKVKLEMAKFLQQTLDDMAPQSAGRSSQRAKDFAEFIEKIRTSGSEVTTEEILRFSKLFEDEITLDSLTRPQLLALCRVLEIPAIGTSTMLRFQLRMRLRNLIADDRVIEVKTQALFHVVTRLTIDVTVVSTYLLGHPQHAYP